MVLKELLFKVGDSKELAEKINTFIKMPHQERQEIGSKLRTYVIDNFSMEQFLKEHENLYSSLIKKGKV